MNQKTASQATQQDVVVFERDDGKWAWHLIVNGKVVANDANQGYENREDATDMARNIVAGSYYLANFSYVSLEDSA